MSSNTVPLEYGKCYHIYNRGINGCDLFRERINYEHFLRLYDKYLLLVADIYAWVLMKNHFHFLVRIKEEEEMGYLPPKILNPDGQENPVRLRKGKTRQGLINLTGFYAQINIKVGYLGKIINMFQTKILEL